MSTKKQTISVRDAAQAVRRRFAADTTVAGHGSPNISAKYPQVINIETTEVDVVTVDLDNGQTITLRIEVYERDVHDEETVQAAVDSRKGPRR